MKEQMEEEVLLYPLSLEHMPSLQELNEYSVAHAPYPRCTLEEAKTSSKQSECCEDQHELRTDGDVVKNCLKLVDKFNKWSKKRYARRYNAILDQAKVDAFGDGVTVS